MSYFGRYLRSLRIKSGFESVSEYLEAKQLPITEAYYRALEGGKKSGKQVMIDTASKLCAAICLTKTDKRQFFLHLLKDILPDEVYGDLVRPVPLESFGDLVELQKMERHLVAIYKAEAAKQRMAASYVPTETSVDILLTHPDWLPLIHYIYMVEKTNRAELADVCRENSIDTPLEVILDAFVKSDIITIDSIGNASHPIARHLPIFLTPILTPKGRKLKDGFLREEINKSLSKGRGTCVLDGRLSFAESLIDAIQPDAFPAIESRIRDLLAEIAASSQTISTAGKAPMPYFISIVVSPRPEYLPSERRMNKTAKLGE